ncbi:MAG TPA: hypothetical protein VF681_07525 [Abditibacteriaceae bacterium]
MSLFRVRSISTGLFAALCLSAHVAKSDEINSAATAASDAASAVAAAAVAVELSALAPESEAQAFRGAMKTRAASALKDYQSAVVGRENWLFFAPELRSVGVGRWWDADATKASQSVEPENADPLPAILDFKAQLDRAGIELLIVPVAPKAVVYAEKIWKPRTEAKRLDVLHHEFYALLRKNGVAVLDLTDDFIAQRDAASGSMYCRTDTHWSGRACVVAARRIAGELEGRAWLPKKQTFASAWKRVAIDGDLRAARPKSSRGPQENLTLRFVGKTNAAVPLAEDKKSPVVLLGDSHSLVFHEGDDMHTKGAGLADQLAFELGFPLDVVGVRGSGATPSRVNLMRRAKANAGYLKGKKLVIWCFSAREWTESLGWNKVPVVP